MGIYPQTTGWACGPFALKHALLAYGVVTSEDELAAVAGTSEEEGTDEVGLARAARGHGCDLLVVRREQAAAARLELSRWLRQDTPVLLCVDEWDHWVAAVAEEGDEIVVLDSRLDGVAVVMPWVSLAATLAFHDADEGVPRTLYDLHPLVARRAFPLRARFSAAGARRLAAVESRAYARAWGEHLTALLSVARAPTGGSQHDEHPLADLIRGGTSHLLDGEAEGAVRLLEHLGLVSETYGLAVRADERESVLEALRRLVAPAVEIAA